MQLPQDGAMLLSLVNMKLRDGGVTLDELCDDMEWDRDEIETRLARLGYRYDETERRFL